MEHEHSDAYHQTNAANQTPEWKYRLRQHVKASSGEGHNASDDLAALLDADIIAERHNLDHGRDAHGVRL